MPAARHQRQRRQLHQLSTTTRLQEECVNVPLDMIHADERIPSGEAKRFRVGQTDQQRANQPEGKPPLPLACGSKSVTPNGS